MRGRHDWRLYDEGFLRPHYYCPCWGRAEINDPPPGPETIPFVLWEEYAARFAAEGCDYCETMRDSCKAPSRHFTGSEIERRRKKILERYAVNKARVKGGDDASRARPSRGVGTGPAAPSPRKEVVDPDESHPRDEARGGVEGGPAAPPPNEEA